MKDIWKTRKKFEIQMVGQNLFLIVFELEEDLEMILEGRPWLFRKSIILFDRLCQAVKRDQIRLISSPFWMKIDSCFSEFDKKIYCMQLVPRLVGFSDLKLMKTSVNLELTWMFRDHFEEVFLSLLMMLVKCKGDPLSPFLFLMCSEGLSSLMRMASKAGLIKGAKASRRSLEI
ncbi:hypothetical protein Goshw_014974, partial [Gossypium schwendimanii]|nr:hypothetical protein [Gossypium schwendimanii]